MRRRITVKELIEFFKNKKCQRTHQEYIAQDLLKDPNHPIASTDSNLSNHLFNTIEIIDEPENRPRTS